MEAMIFDIKRFAVHDGDGIRTTVFFKGCPLRCIWCHNPEGLSGKPALSFTEHKCVLCKRCASVCSCHVISDGKHIFRRENCTTCGKCVPVCPADALCVYKRRGAFENSSRGPRFLRDKRRRDHPFGRGMPFASRILRAAIETVQGGKPPYRRRYMRFCPVRKPSCGETVYRPFFVRCQSI